MKTISILSLLALSAVPAAARGKSSKGGLRSNNHWGNGGSKPSSKSGKSSSPKSSKASSSKASNSGSGYGGGGYHNHNEGGYSSGYGEHGSISKSGKGSKSSKGSSKSSKGHSKASHGSDYDNDYSQQYGGYDGGFDGIPSPTPTFDVTPTVGGVDENGCIPGTSWCPELDECIFGFMETCPIEGDTFEGPATLLCDGGRCSSTEKCTWTDGSATFAAFYLADLPDEYDVPDGCSLTCTGCVPSDGFSQ